MNASEGIQDQDYEIHLDISVRDLEKIHCWMHRKFQFYCKCLVKGINPVRAGNIDLCKNHQS